MLFKVLWVKSDLWLNFHARKPSVFVASHWRMHDPRGVDALASPFACCTRVTSRDIPQMDSLLAGEG